MINANKFLKNNQLIIYFLKEQYGEIKNIIEIGGMTNTNYKVDFEDVSLVLRIPQRNTKKMIDRVDEKINTYLACKIDVDKSFLFIDDLTGIKLSKFLDNGQVLNPHSAKKNENMKKVISILKKLHNSNIEFNNIFNPFKMIDKYEKILKQENGVFFKDYDEIKSKIFKLKEKIKKSNVVLVPCHNDTVPENFVLKDNELNLIDWEYSGMNDCVWDLAAHSLECEFSKKEEEILLKLYFNKNIDANTLFRLKLYKIMQDVLWSIWSNIKIVHGEDLMEYSIMRYKRAKKMLDKL